MGIWQEFSEFVRHTEAVNNNRPEVPKIKFKIEFFIFFHDSKRSVIINTFEGIVFVKRGASFQ